MLRIVFIFCLLAYTQQTTGQVPRFVRQVDSDPIDDIWEGPPVILHQPPKTIYFKDGDPWTFPCEAVAIPKPDYSWTKDNMVIDLDRLADRVEVSPYSGSLKFMSSTVEDEGVYQCFASNKYGMVASYKADVYMYDIESFPHVLVMETHAKIGKTLTIRCNIPRTSPGSVVQWVVKETDEQLEMSALELTERIAMDQNNALHFIYVLPEDNGKVYICALINKDKREMKLREKYRITTYGETLTPSAPTLLYQSPTINLALRGHRLTLMCIFGGYPIPDVTWYQDEFEFQNSGLDNQRVVLEDFGRKLVIKHPNFSDSGTYTCVGRGGEEDSTISRRLSVRVETKPIWVRRPQSVEALEGERVTYMCEGNAIPKPGVRWFINGTPVSKLPRNPRYIFTENILTIEDVRYEDEQVIQCNVSNRHGYVFAEASLDVLEPGFRFKSYRIRV